MNQVEWPEARPAAWSVNRGSTKVNPGLEVNLSYPNASEVYYCPPFRRASRLGSNMVVWERIAAEVFRSPSFRPPPALFIADFR
jgi:hypothetical protein